jgi:hypothetical protein
MGYGLSADPSMRDVKERRETWLGGRQRTVGSFRVRQADGWAGGRNERGFTPLSQPAARPCSGRPPRVADLKVGAARRAQMPVARPKPFPSAGVPARSR